VADRQECACSRPSQEEARLCQGRPGAPGCRLNLTSLPRQHTLPDLAKLVITGNNRLHHRLYPHSPLSRASPRGGHRGGTWYHGSSTWPWQAGAMLSPPQAEVCPVTTASWPSQRLLNFPGLWTPKQSWSFPMVRTVLYVQRNIPQRKQCTSLRTGPEPGPGTVVPSCWQS
jgi:hypothetical protein